MCWINSQNVRDLRTPFGGTKQSGIGREGGDYAFDFYCETEIVHVALGTHAIPRLGLPDDERRRGERRSRDRAASLERRRQRGSAAVRHHARRPTPSCMVTDLDASRALLRRPARSRRQRTAPTTRSTCAAGRSACTTRSSCARRDAPACGRLSFRVRGDARPRRDRAPTSSAAAASSAMVDGDLRRDGPRAARLGSVRLPARVLPRDGAVRDAAAALRHPARRADHAHRPLQHPLARTARRRSRSGSELGFRCTEYISTDGEDERITGGWLARKPTVHDVALTAGRGPRLHHVGLFVAEPVGVLRACDQLAGAYRSRRDRARARAPRRLERVLRLPARPRRPPHRALRLRLLHRRPRPPAAALVGQRPALPLVLRHARARQLVRGVLGAARPRRRADADRRGRASTSAAPGAR